MLKYDFLKRLGLLEKDIEVIDCDKSYYFINSNTYYLTIKSCLDKDI